MSAIGNEDEAAQFLKELNQIYCIISNDREDLDENEEEEIRKNAEYVLNAMQEFDEKINNPENYIWHFELKRNWRSEEEVEQKLYTQFLVHKVIDRIKLLGYGMIDLEAIESRKSPSEWSCYHFPVRFTQSTIQKIAQTWTQLTHDNATMDVEIMTSQPIYEVVTTFVRLRFRPTVELCIPRGIDLKILTSAQDTSTVYTITVVGTYTFGWSSGGRLAEMAGKLYNRKITNALYSGIEDFLSKFI